MKIFGYGTFITSGIYQNYSHVRAAYLSGYIRILRPVDSFPFILSAETSNEKKGFWGLVFEVDREGLARLDFYEGSLYSRIPVNIQYSNRSTETVMVYYPTKNTINQCQLLDYITDEDLWRIRIIERHPEIIEQFPELKETTPP
jgi:gamma-glutamylcyclotransferase (GGCT)/AIG2-like uncharacterized protein YtfP